MAERGILHQSRMPDFRIWLRERGIEYRPGRGLYEVMQVQWPKGRWHAIFRRGHAPEHVSVPKTLYPLVRRFIRDNKKARGKHG